MDTSGNVRFAGTLAGAGDEFFVELSGAICEGFGGTPCGGSVEVDPSGNLYASGGLFAVINGHITTQSVISTSFAPNAFPIYAKEGCPSSCKAAKVAIPTTSRTYNAIVTIEVYTEMSSTTFGSVVLIGCVTLSNTLGGTLKNYNNAACWHVGQDGSSESPTFDYSGTFTFYITGIPAGSTGDISDSIFLTGVNRVDDNLMLVQLIPE